MCQLVYNGIFINTVYVYIIIKMPVMLVLSVNNWYTGLIRANIRHGKNGGWKFFLMEDGYFFKREVSTICPLSQKTTGPSIMQRKKMEFSIC